MTTVVKEKTPLVVPDALRRRAGIVPGDTVEMKAIDGVITIVANPPADEEEYTPEQRRIIDAQLAEAEEDVKQGRTYGPFATHKEFLASLHKEAKKLRGSKKANRSAR